MTATVRQWARVWTPLLAVAAAAFAADGDRVPLPAADSAGRQFDTMLRSIVEQTIRQNPSLKAASSRIAEAQAAARARLGLDAPTVGVERFSESEIDYSVEQMIPFPGKLGATSKAENSRALMYTADQGALERDLIRRVRQSFYELYLVDRRLEINAQSQQLLQRIVNVARTQYEVGTGTQADILRAQTEQSTVRNARTGLEQQHQSAIAMINALRHAPPATLIATVPPIDPAPAALSEDSLFALAAAQRPELAGMQAEIDMRKFQQSAARRERLPDLAVRGMYKQMFDAVDDWSLMLGVTVPVAPWSVRKYTAGIAQADADVQQSVATLDNMRAMVQAEVRDALLRVVSAGAQMIESRGTIVPQAEQTVASAMESYANGGKDFLMLIDSERMLLTTRENYQMSVASYLAACADLERAVGAPVDQGDTQ